MVAVVEENQITQLSLLHSVMLTVVAGGSAVQPLEAEQKNPGKNEGQWHPVRGFPGSPSVASGSCRLTTSLQVPYSFTLSCPSPKLHHFQFAGQNSG